MAMFVRTIVVSFTISLYIGFVSNGEYNVFRLKGYTRPVSVLKLRSAARTKFSSTVISTMEKMLTPKGRY